MGRPRLASLVVGVGAAATAIAIPSQGYWEIAAPALVVVLGLLAGIWAAVAASVLLCAHAVLVLEWWHLAVPLVAAVLCAELLRTGFSLLWPTGLTFLAYATPYFVVPGLQAGWPGVCSMALVYASIITALASMLLWLLPRRSAVLAPHAPLRWSHFLFPLVNGPATLAAVLLLPSGIALETLEERTACRLLWLLSIALAVSVTFSMLFELVSRKYGRQLLQRFHRGGRGKLGLHRMPLEVIAQLLPIVREGLRVRRSTQQLRAQLLKASAEGESLQRALEKVKKTLWERSEALARNLRGHERLRGQMNALMSHIPEPILLVDHRKRIERVSQATLRWLGHEPATLTGQPISILTPPTYVGVHPLDLQKDDPGSSRGKMRIAPVRRADGTDRNCAIQTYEFEIGGARNYLIQLRDPNHTKQALAALQKARAALKHAHESRYELIGSMSHEFRTPLHGLIAMLDMLRDEDLSTAGREKLAIAKASARSLLKLANDVLDLTRFESRGLTFEKQRFDIISLTRQVFEEATPQAASKGLQLTVNNLGELPPSLIGDPQRIKQILTNLVTNAIKFTPQGEIRVHIRYRAKVCTIDVIDTGPGIPPDKVEDIFKPFVQVQDSSQQQGAGLGLAISRQLCEAMGGKLWVLDTSPVGTTFRFTLPLEASNEPCEEDQSLRIFRNPSGHILVVEDHPTNQFVVKSMLDALKCAVTIAGSGTEALELLEKEQFDLILMDCRMPGMDGLETTRRIRNELRLNMPIIAMTANTMPEDIENCKKAGMNDYLPKPFGRTVLHDMLCKWLKPQAPDGDSVTQKLARFPVLDEEIVDELYENLKWQKPPMRRICESFLATARDTLRLLEGQIQEGLDRNLHTLLGTAGMVGARQIEQLAALLQQTVKAGRMQDVPALHKHLANAVAAFEREFLQKLEADHAL
ncbi:MAG TPA: ATP-binding protein [Steroidobacter sp.]